MANKNIVLTEGSIPGYTLAENSADPTRMEVVIHYGDNLYFCTGCTLEEMPTEEPAQASIGSTTATLGEASITKQEGAISEGGMLSMLALINGAKEIPR